LWSDGSTSIAPLWHLENKSFADFICVATGVLYAFSKRSLLLNCEADHSLFRSEVILQVKM